MLNQIIEFLATGTVAAISAMGYAGVALLMAIESACIPLPSEIIMPFAGYLVSTGELTLLGIATAGAIGCNIGSTVAYAVGARGGRPAVERWGRYVLLSSADIDMAERFFARYGSVTVFVCRLLPVVRTFIALPAGIARMNVWRFQAYTFVGSWIWCYALGYVGARLGAEWNTNPTVKAIFHQADVIIVGVGVLGIGFVLWHRLRRRGA
ncbi:MAG: DedA family protein [Phreatobacter sp.]